MRSESHATTHSKHLTASTMCLRCNLHAYGPREIPRGRSLQRQPVEQRTLRSHGTRGGESDLEKVCNEVVTVAGRQVTTFTDSRSKCIGGSQTCAAPAAQISTSAQPLWSCHISTSSTQQNTTSGAGVAQRFRNLKATFATKRSASSAWIGSGRLPHESCECGISWGESFLS